jgi:hypothetical protein
MTSPPHPDYRDEDEGPIILSHIAAKVRTTRHSPTLSDAGITPNQI